VLNIKLLKQIPTPLSQMHMYPIMRVAAGRVPKMPPWAHRDTKYAGVIVVLIRVLKMPIKLLNVENIGMHCTLFSGGVYLNFIMDEGRSRIEELHNGKRLAGIKKKYDPNNFFRVNQNIVPN
jgi:hypothetical protein